MNWSQFISDMIQNVVLIYFGWQIGTIKGRVEREFASIDKEMRTIHEIAMRGHS
jgi:hypothetical protein